MKKIPLTVAPWTQKLKTGKKIAVSFPKKKA
jgi:hypothetical protein